MSFDWQNIGRTIYGILGVSGYSPVEMWDESGARTNDPKEAVRFIASKESKDPALESFDVMIVLHDENNDSHVDLETPTLGNDEDFESTYKLKRNLDTNIKERYGLPVNWSKFSHRIQSKDDSMPNIQESKDISKVYGPSLTTSYQKVGESKLIIRHSDPIDEAKQGSRWRKIKSIFIETKNGERFAYPLHVAGARAMARHCSNDGVPYDEIGEAIKSLSDDYIELKKARTLLSRAGQHDYADRAKDAMHGINRDVKRMAGPRGYSKMITGGLDVVGQDGMAADLTKQFIRDCNWTADDEAKPLATAAKYIAKQDAPSRDHDGMVGKLNDLADRIGDEETAIALRNMAAAIQNGDQPSVEQVKFATEAARSITNESTDPRITRLLQLGGVLK